MVALVLFQPDIPQNTGAILRLGACLDVAVHVIEPAGFDLSDRRIRRAGLDYMARVALCRHTSFAAFVEWHAARGGRLVVMTTGAAVSYLDFPFAEGDLIMLGRESAGLPEGVHAAADARLRIPMRAGMRSLNVALAAAMVLGEALRQTSRFPAAETL